MRLKQTLLTSAVIALIAAFPAHADELQIGCYPKAELLAKLQANQQSQIDKMVLQSESGAKKATLTVEHNGKGYVHGGRGYLIESLDSEACIISRMRTDTGSEKEQLKISSLHAWGEQELTADEWKHVAKSAISNYKRTKDSLIKKGYSNEEADKALHVLAILGKQGGLPGEFDTNFLYQLSGESSPKLLEKNITEAKDLE